MKLNHIDDLQLMSGIDIPISELKLAIRQPTMDEIAMLTEEQYFLALSIFKMNKNSLTIEDEERKKEITNWMIFNETLSQKIDGVDDVRVLILNFLRLFAPKLNLGPRSIMIEVNEEIINISEDNFDLFQAVICEAGAAWLLSKHENEDFNPINEQAAAIAEKMKEARKRLAKLREAETGVSDSKGFLARYVKAVSTMTANSLQDVKKMTIYQLNEIMQMYLAWEAYDLEIKSRLAGAKGDAKLVHWIMRKEQNETTVGTI